MGVRGGRDEGETGGEGEMGETMGGEGEGDGRRVREGRRGREVGRKEGGSSGGVGRGGEQRGRVEDAENGKGKIFDRGPQAKQISTERVLPACGEGRGPGDRSGAGAGFAVIAVPLRSSKSGHTPDLEKCSDANDPRDGGRLRQCSL